MNITVLGAAGFIGTNLILQLAKKTENNIIAVDEHMEYFNSCLDLPNVKKLEFVFDKCTDFETILKGQDLVYHLISTNCPASSNQNIGGEITDNISISIRILESCVINNVKKIVFISSGGTVYGNVSHYPICEDDVTQPITTYGIQKLTIEKLLYLYHYIYDLDYVVIRLANPYGPYQRPNGRLGVVSTFAYKALHNEKLTVYGDGNVIRDYIYISDAVEAMEKIAVSKTDYKIFNIGSGIGTSINEIIKLIEKLRRCSLEVEYISKRTVDVSINYLDISRYESVFGKTSFIMLEEGIKRTLDFFVNESKGMVKW